MEQADQPLNVGSMEGLGVTATQLTDSLRQMIDDAERADFQRFLDANGELTALGIASFAWCAWRARAALTPKCRGVRHPGCDYLAACGHVCNKCGELA